MAIEKYRNWSNPIEILINYLDIRRPFVDFGDPPAVYRTQNTPGSAPQLGCTHWRPAVSTFGGFHSWMETKMENWA